MVVSEKEAKMDGSSLSSKNTQIEDFGIRVIQRQIDGLKGEIEKGIYRLQEEGNNHVAAMKQYKDVHSVDITWSEHYAKIVIKAQDGLRALRRSMEDLGIEGNFKW